MIKPLVLQSDFGLSDGAVSAMYGVALGVHENIRIFDLTHDIPPYNIWEASYRITQTVKYWPTGTVFVSVVDPGVGTRRLSLVVKLNSGHYVVTPDNGSLTHLLRYVGVQEARVIDESVNRLPASGESYTFHGRDVYAYTGARLAAGIITYEQVGPEIPVSNLVQIEVKEPVALETKIVGTIDVHDVRYGSLWSNIPIEIFRSLGIKNGEKVKVSIANSGRLVYANTVVVAHSFAEVGIGEALVYPNSLCNMAVAINRGSFAQAYNISSGNEWSIEIEVAA